MFRPVIIDYIRRKYAELVPLYEEIYSKGNRDYWEILDRELRAYAKESGLSYVRNDDSMNLPFEAPPVLVNFFYHEEIKKSAKKINRKK